MVTIQANITLSCKPHSYCYKHNNINDDRGQPKTNVNQPYMLYFFDVIFI